MRFYLRKHEDSLCRPLPWLRPRQSRRRNSSLLLAQVGCRVLESTLRTRDWLESILRAHMVKSFATISTHSGHRPGGNRTHIGCAARHISHRARMADLRYLASRAHVICDEIAGKWSFQLSAAGCQVASSESPES